MNIANIKSIIRFEFQNEVRKKSFLLLVLLPPIMFLVMFIMNSGLNSSNSVVVINNSVLERPVENSTKLKVVYEEKISDPQIYLEQHRNCDGLIILTDNKATGKIQIIFYTSQVLRPDNYTSILSGIKEKLADQEMHGVITNAKMLAEQRLEVKNVSLSDSNISFYGLTTIAILIIYFIIFQFSANIMRSINMEKSNKISEILLSSMKAKDIMMGKILNGFLLAVVQMILWVVLLIVFGKIIGQYFDIGSSINILDIFYSSISSLSASEIITLGAVSFIVLVGGYLLYAIFFSIIGAISNENTNSQQFSFFLTMPLLMTFIYVLQTLGNTNTIKIFLSYFPLTSPIALIARLTGKIELYEIVLSLALLFLTIAICLRYSSSLYKRGILEDKAKITFTTLVNWIKERQEKL